MRINYLSLKRITRQHADELRKAVNQVVDSGWYLQGKATHDFETAYAQYIGTRHCIGCGNGLDALILIFRAYKELGVLNEGDEVIVPANTYIASILALTENRLTPILIEPNAELQIDSTQIEQAITPKTRAILLVHLYGICAMNDAIRTICHRHKLLLVEDNAQGHGLKWNGLRTGSIGNAAAHSFYPGKNMGAFGDAGCVTTNDEMLANAVQSLGNYGSNHKYVFPYQGLNSRIDEVQAAVIMVKLKYLDADNQRRKTIALRYLEGIENKRITLIRPTNSVFHIFPILCEQRDNLQAFLHQKGIETMVHYPIPPHRQACFKAWNRLKLPITERIAQTELSLPCNQAMTDEEVETVIRAINQWTETY